MRSGFAFKAADGTVDLVFSNQDGLCESVKAAKLHAGEALVQAYRLAGTAPGTFTNAGDTKYVRVKATCTSGQPLGTGDIDKASRADTATFSLTQLSATVATGTMSASYADGSSVAGSFSVPICEATVPETSACF
jgi:hypothetical protein